MMNIPSKLIEDAVDEFSKLPGVGKKTALRFVLHLLKRNKEESERLGNSIITMRNDIKYCRKCNNISERDLCNICSDHTRDVETLCIIQDIRDVMAIENTTQYRGVYHVLGGLISPMDGIGPKDLHIESLVERLKEGNVKEVIMAVSATMEGDTTVFYISKRIKEFDLKISTIARGVAVGDELEYADEITLGRSIINRTPYELK